MLFIRGDLYVNNREQYSAAMQYGYQMLEPLPAEEILQWECIPRIFDKIVPDMQHATEKPIWLPVYAKEKNMLLDIIFRKYAEVPAEQFEKMDALRKDFLNQID